MSVILSEKEKERRKAIWDKMTPDEQQDVENKRSEITEWSIREEGKIIAKLKEEGKYRSGVLDGYYPELVEHGKKRRQLLHDLLVSVFGEENAGDGNGDKGKIERIV